MDINAILQGFAKNTSKAVNLATTPGGALYTAGYGSNIARWVAEGKGYRVIEATATAGVAALPTVTAGLTIQNGEPDNGKWYVVHSVFASFEASAAAVESAYIAHCVGMNRVAAATQDLALTSVKPLLAGAGPYSGLAILDLGATVVDDLWMPATSHVSNLVASNGEFSLYKELDGIVVIKPKAQYSLEICATTTGVTGRLGLAWFEVDREELIGA